MENTRIGFTEDKVIVCQDCGKEFTFTVKEQRNYFQYKFDAPKRCKDCRFIKKLAYLPNANGGTK